MNTVFVEYDGGINTDLETSIHAAASYDFGKESKVKCDSGCCMFEPYTRDLAFYYDSAEKAAVAAEKLRRLTLSGVRVRTELDN